MDCFKKIITLPWKVSLIPLLSEDPPTKLPLYGPLNIQNYSQFLNDGKHTFNECYTKRFPHRVSLNEFKFLHCLAVGGFGKIILAEQKNKEKSLYAMKAISKSFLIMNNGVESILNEKRILQSLHCPFCVRLEYLCQSNSHLYMFLPFISGGDVFTHLRKFGKFEENLSKFYGAQVILALEFMQNCDVIHRDLKPENILVDHFGFVKLTDFGLAKVVSTRTYTFCGTVEYAAPEVILGQGYGKAVDWWSLGILLFEMTAGQVPFTANDELETLEKIVLTEFTVPEHFSSELKSLVAELLQKNATKRVGNLRRGVEEIKSHLWFKGIDWMELLNRKVVPPFIPDNSTRLSEVNFPNISSISNISISRPAAFDQYFQDF